MKKRHSVSRKIASAKIICTSPCVCLTPMGSSMVPVPYMIWAKLDDGGDTVTNVSFNGHEAFTMNSHTTTCYGNEPGTGGGIISGVNLGYCRPLTNKDNMTIKGKKVIHDDCVFGMNCHSPKGVYNTTGKLFYDDRGDLNKVQKS